MGYKLSNCGIAVVAKKLTREIHRHKLEEEDLWLPCLLETIWNINQSINTARQNVLF
jgi:hypothetical protein